MNLSNLLGDVSAALAFIAKGRDKTQRPVANNTYLVKRASDTVALRLHETDVVTITPTTVTFDSGGWRTSTTRDRMSYMPGFSVYSEKGVWWVRSRGFETGETPNWSDGTTPFFDGITFDTETRRCLNGGDTIDAIMKKNREGEKLRKRIRAYAKGSVEWLNETARPVGYNGDCFFCLGNIMGDRPDTSHLLSHIDEDYFMISLIVNASLELNSGDRSVVSMTLGMRRDGDDLVAGGTRPGGQPYAFIQDRIETAVYRYLVTRLLPEREGSTPTGARPRAFVS